MTNASVLLGESSHLAAKSAKGAIGSRSSCCAALPLSARYAPDQDYSTDFYSVNALKIEQKSDSNPLSSMTCLFFENESVKFGQVLT